MAKKDAVRTVEQELSEATQQFRSKDEPEQQYLERVLRGSQAIPDDQYAQLSRAAQVWVDDGIRLIDDAETAGEPVPPIPPIPGSVPVAKDIVSTKVDMSLTPGVVTASMAKNEKKAKRGKKEKPTPPPNPTLLENLDPASPDLGGEASVPPPTSLVAVGAEVPERPDGGYELARRIAVATAEQPLDHFFRQARVEGIGLSTTALRSVVYNVDVVLSTLHGLGYKVPEPRRHA